MWTPSQSFPEITLHGFPPVIVPPMVLKFAPFGYTRPFRWAQSLVAGGVGADRVAHDEIVGRGRVGDIDAVGPLPEIKLPGPVSTVGDTAAPPIVLLLAPS